MFVAISMQVVPPAPSSLPTTNAATETNTTAADTNTAATAVVPSLVVTLWLAVATAATDIFLQTIQMILQATSPEYLTKTKTPFIVVKNDVSYTICLFCCLGFF